MRQAVHDSSRCGELRRRANELNGYARFLTPATYQNSTYLEGCVSSAPRSRYDSPLWVNVFSRAGIHVNSLFVLEGPSWYDMDTNIVRYSPWYLISKHRWDTAELYAYAQVCYGLNWRILCRQLYSCGRLTCETVNAYGMLWSTIVLEEFYDQRMQGMYDLRVRYAVGDWLGKQGT